MSEPPLLQQQQSPTMLVTRTESEAPQLRPPAERWHTRPPRGAAALAATGINAFTYSLDTTNTPSPKDLRRSLARSSRRMDFAQGRSFRPPMREFA